MKLKVENQKISLTKSVINFESTDQPIIAYIENNYLKIRNLDTEKLIFKKLLSSFILDFFVYN